MSRSGRRGTVYLVGAGPGDPGLMTRRSLELIEQADAIFYDRLIPAEALAGARPDAMRVYVGKSPRGEGHTGGSTSQKEIISRLIAAAEGNEVVVRLKGGDPFVFGRGGEEAEALWAAGVPFEVVPGVTAGVAGPAYAGIPVTHRGEAGAVAFVTGHPAEGELDWPGLASFPGTLVIYMGVRNLAENCAALIAAGRDSSESAAVIESATLPTQRVIRTPLGELAKAAAEADVQAPALVVIGEVAAHADQLTWFQPGPLSGKKVAVTRARAQAGATSARLRSLGAEVVELPAIWIEPKLGDLEVEGTIDKLRWAEFDLITLTSVNGVRYFFEALAAAGLDSRALAGVEIAAIGPATMEALAAHGVKADHVPERAIAESLLDSLAELDLSSRSVLVAGAGGMRSVLPEGLAAKGAEVTWLELYEAVPEPLSERQLDDLRTADFITIASASAATNLARALQGSPPTAGRIVSIGPITSAAAREHGLPVHAEADPHTIDGLIAKLLELV